MSFRIKSNFDAKNEDMLSHALQAGGEVLNGAREVDGPTGLYIAANPGMDLYGHMFTLRDKWFNGESQDIATVTKAVEEATGIKLKFDSQMLSSEPAIISSYEIVNQEKYAATVGKLMKFLADMPSGPKS